MAYKRKVLVDGKEFEFYHISVRKLNALSLKIGKIVLPILSEVIGKDLNAMSPNSLEKGFLDAKKNLLDQELDLGKIFQVLADNADVDAIDNIKETLLSECICVGIGKLSEPAKFEHVFRDNPFSEFKVAYEAFITYFKDYFSAGLDVGK